MIRNKQNFETLSYSSTFHEAAAMRGILEAHTIPVEIEERKSYNHIDNEFDTSYLVRCPVEQYQSAAEILEDHNFRTMEPSEFFEFNRQHLIQEMDDEGLIASVAADHLSDRDFAKAAEKELERRGKPLSQEEIRQMLKKHESSVDEDHLTSGMQIGLIIFAVLMPPLGIFIAVMYATPKTTAPDGSCHFSFGESSRRSAWAAIWIGIICTAILIYITAQGW